MPSVSDSRVLVCRAIDAYSRGRLPFEAMQARIGGFVAVTVRRELRSRLVRGPHATDDLAAHDDVSQEIWQKLFSLRHKPGARFRAARNRLGWAGIIAWLRRLCANEVVNYCRTWRDARRTRKFVALPEVEFNAAVDRRHIGRDCCAALAAEAAVVRAVMQACLAKLSASDQEAIRLRYWEGLTDRQAAGRIGRTPATFTRRVNKAASRLKRLLGADGINALWPS
ncbi:MAG: RNA polymerase sigma factor [Planctomycetaceae bacterium]